ncbi:DUF2786 domain-containing protein [Aeromicrobium sp. CTD01-1L150]|uniref:DUF7168 domain-containing protein n=1 Tax=Aeromicrobium sp. CTD01-1L150 TaxID=3341830 RepID=UPI0035C1E69D
MDDPDQNTTYAAEHMLTQWLDAVSPETGEVRVSLERAGRRHTRTYHPETEPHFSRPSEVTGFVERVLERLRSQSRQFGSSYRGREKRSVQVLPFPGWTKATYRNDVILLPERERGGAWALRGLVVLHELAHHLNTGLEGAIIDVHGAGFRATLVQLLQDVGWTEISAMLQEAYGQVGLDRRRSADDGMLAKVGKLLRHAEGASTEAERETFFAKAQELATTHSIELAVARAAHAEGSEERLPTFEPVRLGHRGQHSNVRFVELMLQIAHANDLRCSINADNTGVTLYGFTDDIDVTKTLYVSLVVQMVADADAYIRSGAHRPVHGRTARAAFYQGWTTRIGQRLAEAQRAAQVGAGVLEQTLDARGEVRESKAVALIAKDVELDDYFDHMKNQHGISRTWRAGKQVADPHSDLQGRAAAERARLHQRQSLSRAR